MPLTKDHIREALAAIEHPALGPDPLGRGVFRQIAVCDGHAAVTIALPGEANEEARAEAKKLVLRAIYRRAAELGASVTAQVHFDGTGDAPPASQRKSEPAQRPHGQPPQRESLPGVRRVIAVGAGKGGVGKSTVAVNLAVGLARMGRAVGILDGDIYGPSLPTLLGLHAMEPVTIGDRIQPFPAHGLKAMTIGCLVEADKPLIWRGPMAHGAFRQLLMQTDWGDLDDLVIDLPPGTGDVTLTMSQLIALDGAVIVCTPQRVAQDDASRAVNMFRQLGIDVLGVVENMSYFIGDDGKEYDIFGRGGAERMAERLGVPFLGAVPINTALRASSDAGDPVANFEGGGALAESLMAMTRAVAEQIDVAAARRTASTPTLSVH